MLHEHLAAEPADGESHSAIVRRLAEEALLLRSHPLIKAMQDVDFKQLFSGVHLNHTPTDKTHSGEMLHNTGIEIRSTDTKSAPPATRPDARTEEAQQQQATPPSQPMSGSLQMAGLLVKRESCAR